MTHIIRNVVITIISLGITFSFMYYINFYFFMNLGDWTFKNFQKFILFEIKPIDNILIQYSPLLFIYPILKYKMLFWKEMILMTVIGVCSTFLLILIGITIALFTWQRGTLSSWMPDYTLEQPFANYWTVFMIIGVLTPVLILVFGKRKVKNEYRTID